MTSRPSLDDVLELARGARRSPHGRQVLFDALIERYGRHFLLYLKKVQTEADRIGLPMMVFLEADRLPGMEQRWPELQNWGAYAMFDVLRMTTVARRPRPGVLQATALPLTLPLRRGGYSWWNLKEQLLVTVCPRGPA